MWIPTASLVVHPAPFLTSPYLARKTQRATEAVEHPTDLGERVGTGAAARAPIPRRRPAVRCVDGRPAKPARRDNAPRVFTRRERPNLHAHAGRARAAGPTSSYWTPLWVRLLTQAAARRTIAWLFDRILY
jgi:hypothetical protein